MHLNATTIPAFQKELLAWYQKNKRDLPFRQTKDPYQIWLSEIMLQQTTMSTALPYFSNFMKKFPTLKSVAMASEQDLLCAWQGLGYYSRVRNFHKACQQVLKNFKSQIPKKFAELKTLKGVGDYTAAAISSICFGEKQAVVDGNVKRVLARLFTYTQEQDSIPAKTFFSETAKKLLHPKRPGDHNQALMEIGALICRPKKPTCLICPVQKYCLASRENPEKYPIKKKQVFKRVDYHSLLIQNGEKLLFKSPHPQNLIANMWELPSHYDGKTLPQQTWKKIFKKIPPIKKLGAVRHSIMNQKIITHVYTVQTKIKAPKDFRFLSKQQLENVPWNTLSKKILKKFVKNPF